MLQAHLVHRFKYFQRNVFVKLFATSAIHLQINQAASNNTFTPHVFNLLLILTFFCLLLSRLARSKLLHGDDLFY